MVGFCLFGRVFAVEKVFGNVHARDFGSDCLLNERVKSDFPACQCRIAARSCQFKQHRIILTAKVDASVLSRISPHEPAFLIKTSATVFCFFNNAKTEYFGHCQRCVTNELVITEKRGFGIKAQCVFMNGKTDLVYKGGICDTTTQRNFNQTAFSICNTFFKNFFIFSENFYNIEISII